MSSDGQLPDYLVTSLSQSVSRALEAAIQDPAVSASCDLISVKIAAVRRCIDDAISTVLNARNLPPKYGGIWPLVWAHLPVTDLMVVSHVCRAWRNHVLGLPALWSQLELRARAGEEPDFGAYIGGEDTPTISNLHFLISILPRSNSLDIKLEVQIESYETTEEFNDQLRSFLSLVARRLGVLRIVTMNPELPVELFASQQWTFPRLHSLSLLSETPEKDRVCGELSKGFPFDCRRVSLPSLIHLEIHSDFRLAFSAPYPHLRRLSCAVHLMKEAGALLLASPALDALVIKCTADPFDVDVTPEHAQLVTRLDAIPEVHLITPRDANSEERVLRVFANAPRRRLLLDFDCSGTSNDIPFFPQPCASLTSATHLAISLRPDDGVVLKALDAAHPERVAEIALTNYETWGQALALTVDWARIASLPDLISLTVDATLWSAVVINFPPTPQLAGVTLKLTNPADLGTLLAARQIHRIPASVPLMIDSAAPVGAAPERLHAVKEVLGAAQITVL